MWTVNQFNFLTNVALAHPRQHGCTACCFLYLSSKHFLVKIASRQQHLLICYKGSAVDA